MNGLLWVVAALLAVAFTMAGINHGLRPKERLKAQMPWTEDFSQGQLRGIGLLELLAAVGLVLPPLLGVAEWLCPVAASGLVLLMSGAVRTHIRRGDPLAHKLIPALLGLLAAFVAIGRFWIEPF